MINYIDCVDKQTGKVVETFVIVEMAANYAVHMFDLHASYCIGHRVCVLDSLEELFSCISCDHNELECHGWQKDDLE